MDGYGERHDNDLIYIGYFKEDKFNGCGTIFNKRGELKYQGEFINGNLEGNGEMNFDDGGHYKGQFKNNLLNGEGIYYSENKCFIGKFKDNAYEGNNIYNKIEDKKDEKNGNQEIKNDVSFFDIFKKENQEIKNEDSFLYNLKNENQEIKKDISFFDNLKNKIKKLFN